MGDQGIRPSIYAPRAIPARISSPTDSLILTANVLNVLTANVLNVLNVLNILNVLTADVLIYHPSLYTH